MENALRLRDVAVGFPGQNPLVEGITLDLVPGEAVAIMGPSGGGKSTILKTIAGLNPMQGGAMEILGTAAPGRPAKGRVGYVPQRLGLVRHGSVLDNVRHGALHEASWWQNILHRIPEDATERAWRALESVNLADKAHEPIIKLSGGQQRRIAVARTLVQRPKLLLADEFLGELDAQTASMVAGTVRKLQHDVGTAVVLVEHHLEQAHAVADRVFRVANGKWMEVTSG
jgi:ABC-type phosphate/phosphonate transport system ATPase subunit